MLKRERLCGLGVADPLVWFVKSLEILVLFCDYLPTTGFNSTPQSSDLRSKPFPLMPKYSLGNPGVVGLMFFWEWVFNIKISRGCYYFYYYHHYSCLTVITITIISVIVMTITIIIIIIIIITNYYY